MLVWGLTPDTCEQKLPCKPPHCLDPHNLSVPRSHTHPGYTHQGTPRRHYCPLPLVAQLRSSGTVENASPAPNPKPHSVPAPLREIWVAGAGRISGEGSRSTCVPNSCISLPLSPNGIRPPCMGLLNLSQEAQGFQWNMRNILKPFNNKGGRAPRRLGGEEREGQAGVHGRKAPPCLPSPPGQSPRLQSGHPENRPWPLQLGVTTPAGLPLPQQHPLAWFTHHLHQGCHFLLATTKYIPRTLVLKDGGLWTLLFPTSRILYKTFQRLIQAFIFGKGKRNKNRRQQEMDVSV